MAEAMAPEAIRIHTTISNRYIYLWTIKGWNSFLNSKDQTALEQKICTGKGEYVWTLKLISHSDDSRKQDPIVIRLAAVLTKSPDIEIKATGNFKLLDARRIEIFPECPTQKLTLFKKKIAIIMNLSMNAKDCVIKQHETVNLQIELNITEPCRSSSPAIPLTVSEMEHLSRKTFDPETVDTAVLVDGKVIPAHQAVLAEGSVIFKEQLKQSSWKKLCLENLSLDTAKELIRFMYTNEPPKFERMKTKLVLDVLQAADLYYVDGLKKYAVERIASHLNASNAIDVLIKADEMGISPLKERTLEFIKNNKQLLKSEIIRLKEHGTLLNDVLCLLCS